MNGNDADTLRVEARFKNARLFNAIRARALPPTSPSANGAAMQVEAIKPWCEAHGFQTQTVYDLLNLRSGPISRTQKGGPLRVRDICVRLAALLDCDVQWLFPADLYAIKWPRLAVEMSHELMASLPPRALALPPTQDDDQFQRELRGRLGTVLGTLTPREQKVIRMRFGIGDEQEEMSLSAVGKTFGLTREGVRHIEAKALRKLRHPSRARPLREFVEPLDGGDAAAKDEAAQLEKEVR